MKKSKKAIQKGTPTRKNSTENVGSTPKRGNYHFTPKKPKK